MRAAIFLLPFLSAILVLAKDTPRSVERAFIQAGLVPDVLSKFEPKVLLDVTFVLPDTGEEKAVSPPGRNFTRPQTLNSPILSIPSAHDKLIDETFVIAMVDPDAPTPQQPTHAQIRHFLGGNFKLQRSASVAAPGMVLVNSTPALSEYRQPTPPNTSDPHRYTWLLFRQPLDFPTTISSNVSNFNISAFGEAVGLGPALAGNFMTVSTNPEDLAAAEEA